MSYTSYCLRSLVHLAAHLRSPSRWAHSAIPCLHAHTATRPRLGLRAPHPTLYSGRERWRLHPSSACGAIRRSGQPPPCPTPARALLHPQPRSFLTTAPYFVSRRYPTSLML